MVGWRRGKARTEEKGKRKGPTGRWEGSVGRRGFFANARRSYLLRRRAVFLASVEPSAPISSRSS